MPRVFSISVANRACPLIWSDQDRGMAVTFGFSFHRLCKPPMPDNWGCDFFEKRWSFERNWIWGVTTDSFQIKISCRGEVLEI